MPELEKTPVQQLLETTEPESVVVFPPSTPAPKKPRNRSRSRSRSRSNATVSESKPKAKDEKNSNAPWVVIWGAKNENNRLIIGCDRCGARLSFPYKSPVFKVEDALYSFRIDHQDCKEGDKPPEQATVTNLPKR